MWYWLGCFVAILTLTAIIGVVKLLWSSNRNFTLVYISSDGRVFLKRRGEEGNWVDVEQFEGELQRLKQSRGWVHYTPHHDDHCTDQVKKCLERITTHALPLKLVDFHPLMWFEIQECPFELRFFVGPDKMVLFGYMNDSHGKGGTWIIEAGKNTPLVLYVLEELDQLIRSSGIMNLPEREPERVLQEDVSGKPSFHIRLAFADDTSWRAWYEKGREPAEVQALFVGAREIGIKHLAAAEGEPMTADEVNNILKRE